MVDDRLAVGCAAFRISALLLSVLLAAACSGPPDIRTVDFKNFSYSADCLAEGGAEKITTSNGRFEGAVDSLGTGSFEVRDIAYGDLTGDGGDEAAVVTACSGGGSGLFDQVLIFSMQRGGPEVLTRLEGGDRAAGGVHAVSFNGKTIEVGRYGEAGSGLCCPDYVEWTTFTWDGEKLSASGANRRTVVPGEAPSAAERVGFEPGSPSTVIAGAKGPASYSFAGRAGQTLRVHLESGDVGTIRISTADGAYLGTISGIDEPAWTGKLPHSGEYRITVVRSEGAYALRVSLD